MRIQVSILRNIKATLRTIFHVALFFGISFGVYRGFFSYTLTYDYSLNTRSDIANQGDGEIHVAAVWLDSDRAFMDGVNLAVKEVNEQGLVLKLDDKKVKAKLVIHEYDDTTDDSAQDSRLSIAEDHKIVAVVGHSSSASAIPASITYEYNGILFISTAATADLLTEHNFIYTFSIIPTEEFFVGKLIKFSKERNWNKLLLVFSRNLYGLNLYQRFSAQVEPPLEIVAARSFFVEQSDYKGMIYDLMNKDFDAVVMAAAEEHAAKMIEQLREMGVNKPIIGGDGLDILKIWDWSNQTANQTYVASIFSGKNEFNEKFKNTYGVEGSYSAYQGYEAIRVLADAIQKTGSSNPIQVASTLKYGYAQGYGGYFFDKNGLASNKEIYIKQIVDGRFVLVE
ncbi:ABC transporter substrate-binding protein [Methylomonas sp. MV1]|uniref:ABC transporter substrate-binding protein n=1 Tax=Methylomonas sp. MV1 TaxID=3073620 RepID=UPI0028A4D0EB|nr:ABC transporter substrate-binding protein [Methylomonas sp. MV1]MDT4332333.1 ABC transporter substrate-binding protein [Methylomonas sp. MV1]